MHIEDVPVVIIHDFTREATLGLGMASIGLPPPDPPGLPYPLGCWLPRVSWLLLLVCLLCELFSSRFAAVFLLRRALASFDLHIFVPRRALASFDLHIFVGAGLLALCAGACVAAALSFVLSFTVGGRSDPVVDAAIPSTLLRVLDFLPTAGEYPYVC